MAGDNEILVMGKEELDALWTKIKNTFLAATLKGAANGLAELDANGLVPSSQLPSYVDDVLEYASKSAFPATGETGKIYVALDTNLTYRWSGTAYVEISPSLALGETSSTAYRGDRGATAYAHAADASRLTTAQASGFYKFATTAEGHIASVTAVTASDLTTLIGSTTYAPYNSAGYLPLSGGTMTGSIERAFTATDQTPCINIKGGNYDNWIWRVSDTTYATSASYGFGLKYLGLGNGNNKCLALYADAQTGTQVETFKMYQDGTIRLAVTPNVNGTNVSLDGHTHATRIAASTGTNQITLGYGSKYAITAGGTSYVFTMPSLGYTATQAALGNHLFHKLTADSEYFDRYDYANLFRIVTESFANDTLRFKASTISNVQYWNYDTSAWVTWNKDLSVLFDGNHKTGTTIPYGQRKFRFQITASSGWPSIAMFLLDGSWFESGTYTTFANNKYINVNIETRANTSSEFASKLNFSFSNSTQGTNGRVSSALHTGETLYRITIELCPWSNTSNSPTLYRICLLSNYSGNGVEQAAYDSNANFYPLADNSYCLGNTTNKWKNVYATTFTENGTVLSSKYLGINANAVSATKLETARTLWGQSFDGSANVSGVMTDVTTINGVVSFTNNGSSNPVLNIDTVGANTDYVSIYVTATHRPLVLQMNAGKVGIGVAQPTNKLDVSGAIGLTGQLKSTVATDTAPFVVASTTVVGNLNADLLDGQHGSYYATASDVTTLQGYFSNGVAKSAAKLTTVSKTAWGRTYWTSGGVPDNISGDMSNVGDIAFQASGKNIGGIAYFDTTNARLGIGVPNPTQKLHVNGNICAEGGMSANGYADLSIGGGSGAGSVAAISVGGTAYTPDASALVTIPVSATGNTLQWGAATKIADIGGLALNVTLPADPNKYATDSDANKSSFTLRLDKNVSYYTHYTHSISGQQTLTLALPTSTVSGVRHYMLINNSSYVNLTVTLPNCYAASSSLVVPAQKLVELSYVKNGKGLIVITWSDVLQSN